MTETDQNRTGRVMQRRRGSNGSSSYSESEEQQEQDQEQEQEQDQQQEQESEEREGEDLAAELAQSRPGSDASEGDTARQLDAIRHAFKHQAEAPSGGQQEPQQEPRAEALRAGPPRLIVRKRPAASVGGGGGGVGRQRYMPWLLIAGIAVGTVATVLGVSTEVSFWDDY